MAQNSRRDIQEKEANNTMSETQIIRLLDPLPCCIWAPDNKTCGKPAYVAYVWEVERISSWPLRGLWVVQPVCAECASASAKAAQGDKS